jgi:hypothetical protein
MILNSLYPEYATEEDASQRGAAAPDGASA